MEMQEAIKAWEELEIKTRFHVIPAHFLTCIL